MTEPPTRRQQWTICILLGAAVLAVFWPALRCGFVEFDDYTYVTANPAVQHGLTWDSAKWAFTATHAGYWLPLTWLSHMADCQIYGLRPAGHHLTSLLWHAANSVLLFLVLRRLTGAFWRSALVAGLFSLHPLRVESVVWIAERKDVLSLFFGLLTVGSYVRYVEESQSQLSQHREEAGLGSKLFYGAAVLCFALGLMAKPMLVTLPFVLLLLDYWPLGRLRLAAPFCWRLIIEKLPFFVLALGGSIVTFLTASSEGAVKTLSRYSLGERLANVPVSYERYLGKLFWPENLAAFYPFHPWHWWTVAAAIVLLALVTGWALWQWRTRPYLIVGWLWFLGTMLPTIGVVQAGDQAMADRFTYFPGVGLLIMVVWGMRDLAGRWPFLRQGLVLGSVLAVAVCAVLSARQIRYWKDSLALYTRVAATSNQNPVFTSFIGHAKMELGDYTGAAHFFEQALRGGAAGGDDDFLAAVRDNLGCAQLQMGRVSEAVSNFDCALALHPTSPEAYPSLYYNLGRAFLTNGQADVAAECFQKGVEKDPNEAKLHFILGEALFQQGRTQQARDAWERALQIRPDWVEAQDHLAWLLATSPDASARNGAKAVELARAAERESQGQSAASLAVLAAAYAETGKFSEAIEVAQRARQLAQSQNNAALAKVVEGQLRQYQNAAPVRDLGAVKK